MCQPTDYKEACIESLSGAGDITDPKQLIKAGFEFTKKKLDQIAENSKTLKEAEKDPMAKQALDICRDQMELAMDHLEESFNRIGALDITKTDDVLDDLETWLSSVLTYQGTCLDEFENDGSGDVRSFTEAIPRLPLKSMIPIVVHVKAGIYRETVKIPKNVWNITWIGDGADKTRITFNKNFADGVKTMYTATFTLIGAGHTFKNIGFENSAGAIKHQAVALVVDGDRSAFFNCRFDGYQDTLYAHSNRQFYRDCIITGTIDFIFGDSRTLFQNCLIQIRRPLDNQQNIVVASGRYESHTVTAMVLQNCTICPDPTLMPVKAQFRSYLGRPWKRFAKTIYLQNYIDDVIHPDGWLPWLGTFALDTCYYSEFNNRGPGSETFRRVRWPGIKTLSPAQALEYTGQTLLSDDSWIAATGIPYTRGMM
ncbi:hypothetical protein CRG98_028046 [Punica granatum]|uniref:Pectinesterase n=1 Tax=Punica granatum TaxID=22663 RepID=A0A2I0J700_PUNGR|nr:hypothetical protein CRG98_028046 [Punica granatum]